MDVMDRPPVYMRDGRPAYRASAAGSCLRFLTAARLGYKPMDKDLRLELAAKEGKRHEDWIVKDLEEQGWRVTDRGKTVALAFPALSIEGHIDGIAEWESSRYLLEIKTMSRFQYQTFLRQGFAAFPEYACQIAVYHRCVSLPILYVVKCRDSGETKQFELGNPPVRFEEIYDRLLTCELLARKGKLADGECEYKSYRFNSCVYRYLCGGD